MRASRWVLSWLLIAAVCSGCGVEGRPVPPELVRFDSCDALERALAAPDVPGPGPHLPIERPPFRSDSRGFPSGGPAFTDVPAPIGRDPAEPSRRKITPTAIVEADGPFGDADHENFVVAQGAELRVTRRTGARKGRTDVVALPGSPQRESRIRIEGRPTAIVSIAGVLVQDDRVFVIAGPSDASVPPGLTTDVAQFLVYDISQRPRLLSTISIEGSALSARMIGDELRITTSSRSDRPPRYVVTEGADAPARPLVECDRTWGARDDGGNDLLTTVSIDPDLRLRHDFSVLASPVGLYASDRSFVLASDGAGGRTWVHRFDGSGYVGSQQVPGRLLAGWNGDGLNGWAFSEHRTALRVVTRDPALPDGSKLPRTVRTIVSFLDGDGYTLRTLGKVEVRASPGGIAGVRMLGPIGILETSGLPRSDFVRILDLEGRRIAGFLPLPAGEAGYLALDGDRLLTKRGSRAPYTYTLFDVSDPARPREIETLRARTRFWSHAIEELRTKVTPLNGMPDDV